MKTSHIITASSIGLLSLTMLSGVILSSNTTSADTEVIDQVSLTVPIACTMTGEGTSHTATLDPGTYSGASGSEYENGIGKTTLTAICNDDNGFSISMKLTKVTDSTISYNPQNLTISSDTEGAFDTWHSVPDTYTKVAEYHANTGSSTTDTTLGVKLETTYAAYISSSQPADTYVGQVKYTMVHPYTEAPLQPQTATSGCINYFPNGSNVEGTMGCQSISDTDTSAMLLASNFSRTGYGFAGWSDKFDYATNGEAKFYGPQEDITFTAGEYTGSNNGLALYAVWVKSEGSIQDSTKVSEVCNRLTTAPTNGTAANLSSVSAFTDSRDNNTYAIAKLADGKCWMIENLRLDNSASLTLANTNNPLNDGTNVTLKHNYTDTTTSNTLSPTSNVAYNADTAPDGWCTTNSAACDDQSRIRTDNTANRATDNPNTNSGSMYSYGNYYNWYSATAGNGTYDFSTNNNSVVGDLCPAGWHLPKGGQSTVNTTADFYLIGKAIMDNLEPDINASNGYGNYGDSVTNTAGKTATAAFRSYPNNFVYSGLVFGDLVSYRGSDGSFWSSTAHSSNEAYNLYLYSSYVVPGTTYCYKYIGSSVRCVAPGVQRFSVRAVPEPAGCIFLFQKDTLVKVITIH